MVGQVYERGSMYSPHVLDITDDDMLNIVKSGLANVTAVALATKYPTEVAVPHLIINGASRMPFRYHP